MPPVLVKKSIIDALLHRSQIGAAIWAAILTRESDRAFSQS